ncbi:MAG: hypothetical protein FWH42_05275, partial [Dehalococcoidia bacterium]|nr:hypothetical protein [Dehalococcoidia bacterium]
MNNNGKNNHYLASHQNITPDERLTAQHARGKLSARERISLLLDGNTFHEISCSNEVTDSVITGYGEIDGRQVYIYAQDFTVLGGTISLAEGQKVAKVMEQALEHKVPIIGIHDSGGARIQDGVTALAGVGEILLLNTQCSGIIPQIAIVVGPCAGGAAYSPAL